MIVHQMNFMKHRDLGFDRQNVITIDNLSTLAEHAGAFENYLSSLTGVSKVSKHSGEPGNESMTTVFSFKSKEMDEKMNVLKLAKSFSETNEKSLDIKQKINDFVQEIDKCIVLLKK